MNFTKKSNESWLLTVTTDTDLTGRANLAKLIIKKNKEDTDANAKFSHEETVTNPAIFSVSFIVPTTDTHTMDGEYFYEVWTYNTGKTDALLCDEGTIVFNNPLLDHI
jgi:hypothetical protein